MQKTRHTRETLYQSITNNGILLPKITSSICTMKYLTRVHTNQEYCPLKSEKEMLKPKVCQFPPKKSILIEMILEELKKKGDNRTISVDDSHTPDVDWCLISLFVLNPQHEIFEPQYMPEKGQKGRRGIRYYPETAELADLFEEMTLSSTKKGKQPNDVNPIFSSIYESSHEKSQNLQSTQQLKVYSFQNQHEESKGYRQDRVSIRKVFSDQKQKFGSMQNQINIEKVGSFLELMQEAIDPYLKSGRDMVSNKENAKKKENYLSKENSSNLKRTFENKRRLSMQNYASNEENANGIEKHQMKGSQSKAERDSNQSAARIVQKDRQKSQKTNNNVDQVMKDEIFTIGNQINEQTFGINNSINEYQPTEVQTNQEQLFNI